MKLCIKKFACWTASLFLTLNSSLATNIGEKNQRDQIGGPETPKDIFNGNRDSGKVSNKVGNFREEGHPGALSTEFPSLLVQVSAWLQPLIDALNAIQTERMSQTESVGAKTLAGIQAAIANLDTAVGLKQLIDIQNGIAAVAMKEPLGSTFFVQIAVEKQGPVTVRKIPDIDTPAITKPNTKVRNFLISNPVGLPPIYLINPKENVNITTEEALFNWYADLSADMRVKVAQTISSLDKVPTYKRSPRPKGKDLSRSDR